MNQEKLAVLIIDDDQVLSHSLVLNLELQGFSCSTVDNINSGLKLLKKQFFNIVLCDFRLPEGSGLDFIREAKVENPDLAIILMTGYGDADLGITALRAGAYDYLPKPFNIDELVISLNKIKERERLKAENRELKAKITHEYSLDNIISRSKVMESIFDVVRRVSKFNTTILVTGESGTGKELLARAIHTNSNRSGKPFIAINCGAIPENLMESELFGHKKGAFTDATSDKKGLFEEANGGTIFLDEIGEMPLHLQVKLLRVLQEQQIQRVGDEKTKAIDVRVLAATLKNLEQSVKEKKFRDDLFYRLNVINIKLPALRERTEDIPALIEHFVKKFSKKLGVDCRGINPDALKILMNYHWRGNIRELENCIERALVLANSNTITVTDLPDYLATEEDEDQISNDNLSIKYHSEKLERKLIKKALNKTNGNKTHAAKILEISQRALIYKIKEYSIS